MKKIFYAVVCLMVSMQTMADEFVTAGNGTTWTIGKATPSSAYKIVHAAPNTTPGGVRFDLLSAIYHISESPCGVKNTPKIPGKKEITIATQN